MYRKSVAFKSGQEEAHCNLARLEYHLSKGQPDDVKLKEITDRLEYVLSVNPRNLNAQQLLLTMTGSGGFEV